MRPGPNLYVFGFRTTGHFKAVTVVVWLKDCENHTTLHSVVCLFDLILYVHQQSFSSTGKGLPGLNQY